MTTLKTFLPRPWLTLALVLAVLVTRTNGSTLINPPDATLAAFFLAGLWIPSSLPFILLFAAGALADWFSFLMGVSAWCFTPAYVFLIPTYACLWFGGHFCRNVDSQSVAGFARIALSLAVTTAVAYLISTYSFFYFSGQVVSERSIADYQAGIPRYFPAYAAWAFLYTGVGLAIAYAVGLVRQQRKAPVK